MQKVPAKIPPKRHLHHPTIPVPKDTIIPMDNRLFCQIIHHRMGFFLRILHYGIPKAIRRPVSENLIGLYPHCDGFIIW
jgi:hypothetical protein